MKLLLLFTFALLGMVAKAAADDQAAGAAKLVKSNELGTISTLHKGHPFVSAAPYAFDSQGRPIFLLSDLAVHTENINADARTSIFVQKPDKDVFNGSRVTLLGKMVKIGEKEFKEVGTTFVKRHPKGAVIAQFGDFNFYRLEVEKVFYIGGFGDIGWVDVKDYSAQFKD